MRLWSVHPKYLDAKGIVALWREALLAKNVLSGNTKGYKNHPQLERFKQENNPLACMNFYLQNIFRESQNRDYHFDATKFSITKISRKIPVTKGQVAYERKHLLLKLKIRDPEKYKVFKKITNPETHPLFSIIDGPIAPWEIIQ